MDLSADRILLYVGLITVLVGILLENYFLPAAGVAALVASAWIGRS